MSEITNDTIKQEHIDAAKQIEYYCSICEASLDVLDKHLHGNVLVKYVKPCPNCLNDMKDGFSQPRLLEAENVQKWPPHKDLTEEEDSWT